GRIPKLVEGIVRLPGVRPIGRLFRALASPILKKGLSPKYAGALEYASRYGDAYFLHRGLFMPWELKHVLDAELVETGLEELAHLSALENLCAPIAEPARKIAALEMSWYMRNQLLRDSDWAGMAHSLEIRVPLVDSVLFRQLAPRLLRPGGPTKQTLAKSPSIPLPASVLNRPKTGFAVPVHDWLQADQPDVKTNHLNRGLRGWAQRVYQSAL
ncbi:MAG: asparagine synthase-related protein, partial [Rhodospirillales bacterium]